MHGKTLSNGQNDACTFSMHACEMTLEEYALITIGLLFDDLDYSSVNSAEFESLYCHPMRILQSWQDSTAKVFGRNLDLKFKFRICLNLV